MFLNIINTILILGILSVAQVNFIDNFVLTKNYLPKKNESATGAPIKIANNSLGIKATASNILVIDDNSNVLFAKQKDEVISIASLTKLMTALVFLDNNPGWDKVVTITEDDKRPGGIQYLLSGDQVYVRDLFYLTLISSTNEAAAALVRSTGLSQENFVSLMNQKAKDLKMDNTNFVEVTGLNPANKSTANDLIKLGQAAFALEDIIATTQFSGYSFTVLNSGVIRYAKATDILLDSFINTSQYTIVGSKTGYLEEAGYCQLLEIKNESTGHSIIIAVLNSAGTDDRWQEVKGLVDWTFANYTWSD